TTWGLEGGSALVLVYAPFQLWCWHLVHSVAAGLAVAGVLAAAVVIAGREASLRVADRERRAMLGRSPRLLLESWLGFRPAAALVAASPAALLLAALVAAAPALLAERSLRSRLALHLGLLVLLLLQAAVATQGPGSGWLPIDLLEHGPRLLPLLAGLA